MSLSFPRYSFVQSEPADTEFCYGDPTLCLPMSTPVNLGFMAFGGEGLSVSEAITYTANLYAYAVPTGTACRTDTQSSGTFYTLPVFIRSNIRIFENGSIGGLFDDATYNDSFQQYPIAIGDCFKLQIVYDLRNKSNNSLYKRYFLGCTNCFRRIPMDNCFTSFLQYRSNENCFDFRYHQTGGNTDIYGAYYNKVELPMYLRDPSMSNDTKVYTKSDGSIIKLYERKEEQFILETDLLPYSWLKALDVALSHDTVLIVNKNMTAFDSTQELMVCQKKDNFEIEYQKNSLTAMGKGTCKILNASPIHLYNNNCV